VDTFLIKVIRVSAFGAVLAGLIRLHLFMKTDNHKMKYIIMCIANNGVNLEFKIEVKLYFP
jgi:hypothetical protein